MISKSFGMAIRDIRTKQGISQEKFAYSINMDRTYYSSVEAGKRNISIKNIEKIADGLNISLSNLFLLVEQYHLKIESSEKNKS